LDHDTVDWEMETVTTHSSETMVITYKTTPKRS